MLSQKASIVIPTWNGRQYLADCLESLRRQNHPPDEIIVIDNGSTDGTCEFLAENYPEVFAIPLSVNLGFSFAVNIGIGAASGDIIVFLNNDTVCAPSWLEEIMKAAAARPEYDSFASKVVLYDKPNIIDSTGDEYTPWGSAFNRGHGEIDKGQYDEEVEIFGPCAAAATYRASLFSETGIFDESFFAYYEDIDMSFRARLKARRCLYVPGAVVQHRYSASSGKTSKLGREEVYLHLTALLIKNMPFPLIVKNLLPILFYHSLILVFFLIARLRKGNKLPRVPFFRLMKEALRQRKGIQRNAAVHWRELEKTFTRKIK
ncbi:MAG: glycosyltransferase family 2 protein [bacterium]